ncbi:MAG: hypothetical protein IPI31_14480 [Bacteroidetes bacterium]|nr:hypothetical protein [Bacteroidota bacterium]
MGDKWNGHCQRTGKNTRKYIFTLLSQKLQLLFTGSLDGTVHITDLIKKEEVHKFIPDGSAVYDITIINDNNLVIACGSGRFLFTMLIIN